MRCLLLTFDCLPRRWIGCYGSLDSTTRGFDRLSALGVTFDQAISVDVRSEPAAIAGLSTKEPQSRAGLFGEGRTFPGATQCITSHDRPAASTRGKGQKRTPSRLAQELHQATAWMREQGGPSLAWVRHPGVRPASTPLASQEDVENLLQQQSQIDEELDAFLDEWLDCADERWTFVLTSARGVLRTRSTLRRREPDPAISDDLARVPLLLLEGRGESFGRRRLQLLPTTDLAAALASDTSEPSLARRLDQLPGVSALTIRGDDGQVAVRTADWLFVRTGAADRESGDGLLFEKPQDVCDVFNVRSTQADEAIRLDSLIEA